MHYKLDLGIDHMLIDEAQDTSPEQWDIIKRLRRRIHRRRGRARHVKRSIFAVGDDKQSIFSFQGAAPAQFAERAATSRRSTRLPELEFRAAPVQIFVPLVPAGARRRRYVLQAARAFAGLTVDEGADRA